MQIFINSNLYECYKLILFKYVHSKNYISFSVLWPALTLPPTKVVLLLVWSRNTLCKVYLNQRNVLHKLFHLVRIICLGGSCTQCRDFSFFSTAAWHSVTYICHTIFKQWSIDEHLHIFNLLLIHTHTQCVPVHLFVVLPISVGHSHRNQCCAKVYVHFKSRWRLPNCPRREIPNFTLHSGK